MIAEYVATYHAERKRLAAASGARRASAARKIAQLGRDIDRLVDAIAKGQGDPAVLGPRSTALYKEKEALEADLAAIEEPVNVIALHPAAMDRYLAQVTALEQEIGKPAASDGAAEALHDLVESVTVYRLAGKKGGMELEVAGRLNALLGPKSYPNAVFGTVVAEKGLEPLTRGL